MSAGAREHADDAIAAVDGASPRGWLDVRTPACTTYEGAALQHPPPSVRLSPAWLMLLFGDASPTLVLTLLCGSRLVVDVLSTSALGAREDDGAPPAALAHVAAPRTRRCVWLGNARGARLGYAVSWWAADDLPRFLPDARQPIGGALAGARLELRRELLTVTRSPAHAELDALMGVVRARGGGGGGGDAARGGDALWARWYLMFHGQRAICLVHEVFSPRLQELGMGCMERAASPDDAVAGVAAG